MEIGSGSSASATTWTAERVNSKGQVILECNFGVFKSPKKPTKFWAGLCPMKLRQKSIKNLVGFLGDLKTPKFHSEISRPLISRFKDLNK